MTALQTRATQNEISDYIYNSMNTHDASAMPTARQFADGWAAAIIIMGERFGIDLSVDRYATVTKLANHFGVTFYHMKRALAHAKVSGKKVAGTSKTTYSLAAAKAALDAAGHLDTK